MTGFDADKVTSGSATLKWDKVSGADGYAVELYTGGKWNEVFRTSDTIRFTVKGNSTYSLRIRAFAGTAYSDYTRLAVKTKLANCLCTGSAGRYGYGGKSWRKGCHGPCSIRAVSGVEK